MNESSGPNFSSDKITLRKAIVTILLSIVLVSGSSTIAFLYYRHVKEKQGLDPAYHIVALVQTSQDAEGMKPVFFAELLDLSIDRPKNLYDFNSKEAQKKLQAYPMIKEACVRKIRPGTVHVDYTLRKPIAFLGDFTNTAIDEDKVPFPSKPFFTPKKLPEIYLGLWEGDVDGLSGFRWGIPLSGKQVDLAFELLALANESCCDERSTLSCIDVSHAYAPIYGQRQIVMIFEDRIERVVQGRPLVYVYPRILRLSIDNFKRQLANYLILRSYLREHDSAPLPIDANTIIEAKATIIDLRLSRLAFFSQSL